MSKFKRGVSLVIAVIMAAAVLMSGCAQERDEKKGEGTKGTETTSGGLKPYELLWYSVGTPQNDTDLVFEEVSKYTKEKINASVKMVQFDWGEYNERMQVIIAAGEKFDICFTSSWANYYSPNVARGAFFPLNDLLDEYGKGIQQVIPQAFWDGIRVKGEIYAVPCNKELGEQAVWRFNKEYVDKYNLDISEVRSLESLEPLLKTVKENETFYPISADAQFKPYVHLDYLLGDSFPFAVKMDGKDYKIVNKWEQPEMIRTLEVMHRYFKAGYVRPDVATVKSGDDTDTGLWFVGKAHTQPLADILWSRSLGYDVVSVPIHDPIVTNGSTSGSMQAISITSEEPERAMMFLDLVNTDKYLRNLIDSGIEGVHYEMVNGRQKDLQAGLDRYDMPTFAFGNIMITNLYEADPPDKWDAFQAFNAACVKAPTLGFIVDRDPVETELTAIRNVEDEFDEPLYSGSVDPHEYIPKAVQKMKEAGFDKARDELQRQLDTWREENKK